MPEGQPDHYLFSHAQAAGYPLPLCYPLYFQCLCVHFLLLAITESRAQEAAVSGFQLTGDLRIACPAIFEFHKIYVTNYVVADVIVFGTFGPSWADEASGFRSKSMPALRFCFCALLGLLTAGASARAQNFTQNLIHTFTMSPDGAGPNPIFRDAQGNLYGTTTSGGLSSCQNGGGAGCGIVFEVSSSGEYSVLYSFKGNLDGNTPVAGVTQDAAGNLFGTTGGGNGGFGTVFELDTSGNETPLHLFSAFQGGRYPNTTPTLDASGNIYGTTYYGGDSNCGSNGNGCGLVYEVSATRQFSVLHTFTSINDGIQPVGTLAIDSEGNLYGLTAQGGDLTCAQLGCGTIYEVSKNGKFTVLYQFTGKTDGSYPGCITPDGSGGLYGVTGEGGDLGCGFYGCGTIFTIDRRGGFKTLYAFTPIFPNNEGSSCPIRDAHGNLYGTHGADTGAHSGGYVYQLNTKGEYTDIFDFPIIESPLGSDPSGVVLSPNGVFYGTAVLGGDTQCGVENSGCGTVYSLTLSAR